MQWLKTDRFEVFIDSCLNVENEELILTDKIFSKSETSLELTNNVLTAAITLLLQITFHKL